MKRSRRNVLAGATSSVAVAMASSVPVLWSPSRAQQSEMPPDLIVHNAKVTTLQSNQPEAQAFATRGERIVAVGGDAEIMGLREEGATVSGQIHVGAEQIAEAEIFFAHLDQARSGAIFGEKNFVFTGELVNLLGLAKAAAAKPM